MIGLLVGLGLPTLGAWLALRAWGPAWINQAGALHAAAGVGMGVGTSALVTFWVVTAGRPLDRAFVALDAFGWSAVCVLAIASLRRWPSRRSVAPATDVERHAETASHSVWWKTSFLFVVALSLATVVAGYWSAPHGDWDAWAIWNQRARFLLRAGEGWVDALAISWSQPGHPLLVPSSVARLWAYAGQEATLAPALIGITFGTAAVSLVVATLGPNRPRGWIAGAVLLGPGVFLDQWTAQQADIPFAFFMVSSLALMANAQATSASSRPLLLVGGTLAGFAAWTKNEGVVLVAVTVVLTWLVAMRAGRPRNALCWIVGALPGLATLLWFKFGIAPEAPYYLPNTLLPPLLAERLLSADYRDVIDAALWQRLREWGAPAAPGVMLFAAAAALGLALTRRGCGAESVITAVAAMLFAYYLVYLLTPVDATWLVATTFDRLLVQLWPSVVLATFLAFCHDRNRSPDARPLA